MYIKETDMKYEVVFSCSGLLMEANVVELFNKSQKKNDAQGLDIWSLLW